VAAPAFLSGETKGGQEILGEQVYMVSNSAFSQRGTRTSFLIPSQVPLLSLDLSFPLCFLWFLSYPSLFHSHLPPSPPLIQLEVWASAVSSPSGSGRSPVAKWNLVNSGPRNERFLTCQSGKLQCSLNPLLCIFFDSLTASTVLVSTTCSLIVIFTIM